jgi:hypothetical protein
MFIEALLALFLIFYAYNKYKQIVEVKDKDKVEHEDEILKVQDLK